MMNTKFIYSQRIEIYQKVSDALTAIESLCEMIEDFVPQVKEQWKLANGEVIKLRMAIGLLTPRACPCGSFEFEEKRVVAMANETMVEGRQSAIVKSSFKYICLKCGTEVKKVL